MAPPTTASSTFAAAPSRNRSDEQPAARIDYVLPLRWTDDSGLAELTDYLRWLAPRADVVVVDGSPGPVFDRHAAAWAGLVRHVRPDPDLQFANGKVNGVVTGMRLACHEHVVIADDDVRYDEAGLVAIDALLAGSDLVRPQNYFDPLPWHARWDTGRTLLNRTFGSDYPGTLGIRRSTFGRVGAYDGDVLFENLELIRTVTSRGGTERRAPEVLVRRLPPDTGHFWSQRVRQAYDELAQPGRMAAFLAVWPAAGAAVLTGRRKALAGAGAAVVLAAEVGRRRAGGRAVFPAGSVLFAPVWLAERATCAWGALALRLTGRGVRYGGRRLTVAAHSRRELSDGGRTR